METSSWLSGLKVALTAILALQAHGVAAVPFSNQARAVGSRPPVGGYTYQGCYREPASGRALEVVKSEPDMTLERCAAICAATTKTKAYFGTQYSKECWCGNTLAPAATLAENDSECSSKCAGNPATFCGGSKRLSLYKDESYVPPAAPSAPARVGDWLLQGCWTDGGSNGRTLSVLQSSDDMTIETCAAFAASRGLQYFGAEYGRECWAGNEPNPRQGPADDATSCNIQCKGNTNQICGGRSRMNLYKLSPVPTTTSTTSASTPTSTEPVTHVDLSQASLSENARIVVEDGKTLVELSASNGEARVSVPAQNPPSVQPGDPIVVSVSMKVDPVTLEKRQTTLTNCMLYIFLGGVQIHSSSIWTTDGSYTTVNTVPSGAPGVMSTLIIVQNCPAGAATITIGEIVVAPPAPGSSSTSTHIEPYPESTSQQLPQLPSSPTQQPPAEQSTWYEETFVPPASPTPSQAQSTAQTTSSEPPFEPSAETPQTTSAPPPIQTISVPGPPPQATSYIGPPHPNIPCDRGDSFSCTLSGAPVATAGLLGVVTPIPVAEGGQYQAAYNACARVCSRIQTCASFALDRGVNYLSDNPSPYACHLYSGAIGPYIASGPLREFNHVVWFEASCFECNPFDPSQASTQEPSSTEPPATTAPTTAPPVLTTTVLDIGQDLCFYRGGNCVMSGAPTATSGLLAVATDIASYPGQNIEEQYKACARLCRDLESCSAWALDRTETIWNCYFYSGYIRDYTPSYDPAFAPIVWFEDTCYECYDISSTAAPPAEETYFPSSIDHESWATSSTPAGPSTITAPPQVPTRAVRLDAQTSCSIPENDDWYEAGCTLSGARLKTTGLVAVATGVPAMDEDTNHWNYQASYEICARACVEDPDCGSWALDRGNWPETMDDWTCYLYSGRVREYSNPYEGVQSVVFMDRLCFECSNVAFSSPPVEWSGIDETPSSTQNWASEVTSPPVFTPEPVTTGVDPYTSGVCTEDEWDYCNVSGWPKPTSGLLAVATGVPINPPGNRHYEMQFEMCSRSCKETLGCTFWALDRTQDLSWDCLLYGIDGRKHMDEATDISAEYDHWAWHLDTCYNCTIPEDEEVPASSSTVEPTPTESPTPNVPYYYAPLYARSYQCEIAPYAPGQYICNRPNWPLPANNAGLLGIATGLPVLAPGATDMLPQYGPCLATCMNVLGCQSWVLDSSDPNDPKCLMYDFTATWYVRNARPDGDSAHLAWFDFNCIWCRPFSGPPPVPSTSTISVAPEVTAFPSSNPGPIETETGVPGSEWPQPQTTSSEPPAPQPSQATECTRNPSPPADLTCNLRGFAAPMGAITTVGGFTSQADCAKFCEELNATNYLNCKTYIFEPPNGICKIYEEDAWDALGEEIVGGSRYRNYIIDEYGCWDCPPYVRPE